MTGELSSHHKSGKLFAGIWMLTASPPVSLTSCHHPQSNGQVERLNQEIGRYLCSYCSHEQNQWAEFLPWAEYAQNSLTHSSTGLTPFQCVISPPYFHGLVNPPLYLQLTTGSVVARVCETVLMYCSNEPCEISKSRLTTGATHIHPTNQRVWLSTRDLKLRLPSKKLSPRDVGPLKILRQINDVTFQPELPVNYCIFPSFHDSILKPNAENQEPPLDVDCSPAYKVTELLDSRQRGGQLQDFHTRMCDGWWQASIPVQC